METKENMFEFAKRVETAVKGVFKFVVGGSQEELDEGVTAAKAESMPVSPDINNADHANMTSAEFNESQAVVPEPVVSAEPVPVPVKVKKDKKVEDTTRTAASETSVAYKTKLEGEQDNPAAEERTEGEVEATEELRDEAAEPAPETPASSEPNAQAPVVDGPNAPAPASEPDKASV